MKRHVRWAGFTILAALLLALALPALERNLASLPYLALVSGRGGVLPTTQNPGCNERWQQAVAANRIGQPVDWNQVLACGNEYIPLIQALRPLDRDLALKSVQLYSQNSDAWFWLGESSMTEDKAIAKNAYQWAIALNPADSISWCRLGGIYEGSDDMALAVNAYMSCCLLGDPGHNGCYGAGRVNEKLGDLPAAIAAYRRSTWLLALHQAEELEKSLSAK